MLFDEHLTLAKGGHVLPASLSPIIVVNYRGLILVSRAEMRAAQGRSNQGSKPEPPTGDPRRGRNATTLYRTLQRRTFSSFPAINTDVTQTATCAVT